MPALVSPTSEACRASLAVSDWGEAGGPIAIQYLHVSHEVHNAFPTRCTVICLQVLAGALQDNKRATIAGERTFGKGLIQTLVELSDGGQGSPPRVCGCTVAAAALGTL